MKDEKELEKRVQVQLSEKEEILSLEEVEQVEGGVSSLDLNSNDNAVTDTNYALCGGNGYCPQLPTQNKK